MNKYTENMHKSPPLESTYLYEYYREISDGNIIAGQEMVSGLINYNENPIDKWCLQNTCVKVWDTGHIMPVKPRGMPGKRIDGTASLINAYEIYRRYKSEFTNNLR